MADTGVPLWKLEEDKITTKVKRRKFPLFHPRQMKQDIVSMMESKLPRIRDLGMSVNGVVTAPKGRLMTPAEAAAARKRLGQE